MKKVVGILAMLVSTLSFSQEKIGEYSSSYFKDKTFGIAASTPKTLGKFTYYIDVYSIDSTVKKISLSIDHSDMDEFKTCLINARDKYLVWKKTASDNQVTTLDKNIKELKFTSPVSFLYGSKWKFDFNVSYVFRVKIIDGDMFLIVQNKNELVASNNKYMDAKGFYLVFSSASEIDNFVSKINNETVYNHFNKKNSKENLFE